MRLPVSRAAFQAHHRHLSCALTPNYRSAISLPAQTCRRITTPASKAPSAPPNPPPPSPRHPAAAQARRRPTTFVRASTPPPTRTTSEQLAQSPYIVRRTPSLQLPVYKRVMSGGNRVVVLVKKVDGDRKRLLEDLAQSLSIGKESIRINPTTQHLELKGDYYERVRSWLLEQGF
ncbi:Ribosomal protein L49/IMG2 [Moelleriella libera RCEF 2490]|uniref:Large ribosomal subunit protein mL49 n=1 Tax=Moelleriella libera RCEF 2490 TaxID=1081109 RepID=A0A167ZD68_9HYPO|nr:Ribosomal protein L49/IMG2 [Moelleriella libera RCEF 2490]